MEKIRVGAVSYLNTRPLLYGIKHHPVHRNLELIETYPAKIAELLLHDKIDVGLLPVAAIPLFKEQYIISDFCIGCDGPVASVAIFSQVQLQEIKAVHLDYQSRTSTALAQLLFRHHWQQQVQFFPATDEDFAGTIRGTSAALVIGDRALKQTQITSYAYDLGSAWKEFTGLPFVFAAWVANKQLPKSFIEDFSAANAAGLNSIEQVITENDVDYFDLKKYYTEYISYDLSGEKKKGMALFLDLLKSNSF
ncbi:MAG TPA: menaquinone biosynthesis protein [Chitinophagaceae bacterium]|nr:menaquinone biosynthesis protein [Chitinophagaceae bacterium]